MGEQFLFFYLCKELVWLDNRFNVRRDIIIVFFANYCGFRVELLEIVMKCLLNDEVRLCEDVATADTFLENC